MTLLVILPKESSEKQTERVWSACIKSYPGIVMVTKAKRKADTLEPNVSTHENQQKYNEIVRKAYYGRRKPNA
jgi:hypothetical protein